MQNAALSDFPLSLVHPPSPVWSSDFISGILFLGAPLPSTHTDTPMSSSLGLDPDQIDAAVAAATPETVVAGNLPCHYQKVPAHPTPFKLFIHP